MVGRRAQTPPCRRRPCRLCRARHRSAEHLHVPCESLLRFREACFWEGGVQSVRMFFGFSHAEQHSLKCWKYACWHTSSDCSGYWSQRRTILSRHCCCLAPFICSGVWKSSFTYLHSDAVKDNIGVWCRTQCFCSVLRVWQTPLCYLWWWTKT